MKFSALVLSHNDEDCIGRCLRSLRAVPRVVLVDDGSTDGTREVARQFPNVEVLSHPFKDFARQRNWALERAFAPGEWVLHLDSDEELTPALHRELRALRPPGVAMAYNLRSCTIWRGHPIPRAACEPVYQTRLARGSFRFVQVGHGQKAPLELGPLPRLLAPYVHHPFDKGLSDWLAKHDRYARMEAEEQARGPARQPLSVALRDPIARRQALKGLLRGLPGAPGLVHAYLLWVRGGFWDGPAGREYCRLRCLYEHLVALRVRELARGEGVGEPGRVNF